MESILWSRTVKLLPVLSEISDDLLATILVDDPVNETTGDFSVQGLRREQSAARIQKSILSLDLGTFIND